ncbi:hypothetical protein GOODEAATRI_031128 [Goodea atripinnis]|uniref:Uncharacterized protein n=1 Tax=Goodea atripinnis TaxID=208336 RepID=A0ABV0N5P8_9TELE
MTGIIIQTSRWFSSSRRSPPTGCLSHHTACQSRYSDCAQTVANGLESRQHSHQKVCFFLNPVDQLEDLLFQMHCFSYQYNFALKVKPQIQDEQLVWIWLLSFPFWNC